MYEEEIFKTIVLNVREGKGHKQGKILHFTQTGKTMTAEDCINLCGYNIIP